MLSRISNNTIEHLMQLFFLIGTSTSDIIHDMGKTTDESLKGMNRKAMLILTFTKFVRFLIKM